MATATQRTIARPGSPENSHPSWEDRGTTTIPSRVISRIAAEAAYETTNVGPNAGGLLGTGARHNFHPRPEVTCDIYGQVATIHLNLGLTLPAPLSSIVEDLRAHVCRRIEALTGLTVNKMMIEISWLHPSSHVRKSLT